MSSEQRRGTLGVSALGGARVAQQQVSASRPGVAVALGGLGLLDAFEKPVSVGEMIWPRGSAGGQALCPHS